MNYSKPKINLIGPAAGTVQSSQIKERHVVADSMEILATTAAYEADE